MCMVTAATNVAELHRKSYSCGPGPTVCGSSQTGTWHQSVRHVASDRPDLRFYELSCMVPDAACMERAFRRSSVGNQRTPIHWIIRS